MREIIMSLGHREPEPAAFTAPSQLITFPTQRRCEGCRFQSRYTARGRRPGPRVASYLGPQFKGKTNVFQLRLDGGEPGGSLL